MQELKVMGIKKGGCDYFKVSSVDEAIILTSTLLDNSIGEDNKYIACELLLNYAENEYEKKEWIQWVSEDGDTFKDILHERHFRGSIYDMDITDIDTRTNDSKGTSKSMKGSFIHQWVMVHNDNKYSKYRNIAYELYKNYWGDQILSNAKPHDETYYFVNVRSASPKVILVRDRSKSPRPRDTDKEDKSELKNIPKE